MFEVTTSTSSVVGMWRCGNLSSAGHKYTLTPLRVDE